jgi:hypothetical protein
MPRRRDAGRAVFRVVAPARRIRARACAFGIACAGLTLAPACVAAAGFTALGAAGSQLMTLSRDGRSGAGSLVGGDTGGFRWSEAGVVRSLPNAISVQGMSASGRYVVGSSLDAEQREVATYWNADGTLVRLGGLHGVAWQSGVVSIALGVSDEPRVVGIVTDPNQRVVAFEWSADRGMRELPLPADAKSARASGISEDGRRAYGWVEPATGPRRGVLWNDGAPQWLALPDDAAAGEVLGGNRDLSVLLGVDRAAGESGHAVYRWRADIDAQRLKLPAPHPPPLQLFASSDDGRLLAGSAGTGGARTAMVWTPQAGLQPLERLLAERGIAVPAGWTLSAATGISGDGRRIGGWGIHAGRFDSFVVDLPEAAASARAPGQAD